MASIRRRYLTAALAAAALCACVLTAGPAGAAPAPATTQRTIALKPTPLSQVDQPKVADSKTPAGNCDTVRANLASYRAKGARQVSCVQEVTHSAVPGNAGAVTPAASAVCNQSQADGGDEWVYTRFEECDDSVVVMYNLEGSNGAITGTATFSVFQDILLSPTTGQHVEDDSITFTKGTGTGNSVGVLTFYPVLYGDCEDRCQQPGGSFVSNIPISPGQTLGGLSYPYVDNPLTTQPDNSYFVYHFNWVADNAVAAPDLIYNNPLDIRCDHQLPGQSSVGCVFPLDTPELVLPLSTYGTAAANVLAGESLVPGYPGLVPINGQGSALSRTDPANQGPYHAAMCNTFTPLPSVTNDSCGDYPPSTTNQSGATYGITGDGCLEGIPTIFQGQVYFTELTTPNNQPCIRGHVDSNLNAAVNAAVSAEFNSERVLVSESFYITVTN